MRWKAAVNPARMGVLATGAYAAYRGMRAQHEQERSAAARAGRSSLQRRPHAGGKRSQG